MVKCKRIIKIFLAIFLIYVIVAPLFVEFMYSTMGFNSKVTYHEFKTPEEYNFEVEEKELKTSDNYKIKIYEAIKDNPKGVVIMFTGIMNPSVTYMYGLAQLMYDNGYASILVDVRGHGESDGDKITFAVEEIKDAQAVVDYINSNPKYSDKPIIAMGVSMGGAVAVNAASTIDDIDGLISMSAYSSWSDVAVDTLEVGGYPRWFANLIKPGIEIHGLLSYGLDFIEYRPEETIKQIGNKPILFMHSEEDDQVPIGNFYRIYENYTGDNAEVWIREGGAHFILHGVGLDNPYPDEEYCEKVIRYLEKNFE